MMTARQIAEVVTAFAENKPIQIGPPYAPGWVDVSPTIDRLLKDISDGYEFQVRPVHREPETIWLLRDNSKQNLIYGLGPYRKRDDAITSQALNVTPVRFVEQF